MSDYFALKLTLVPVDGESNLELNGGTVAYTTLLHAQARNPMLIQGLTVMLVKHLNDHVRLTGQALERPNELPTGEEALKAMGYPPAPNVRRERDVDVHEAAYAKGRLEERESRDHEWLEGLGYNPETYPPGTKDLPKLLTKAHAEERARRLHLADEMRAVAVKERDQRWLMALGYDIGPNWTWNYGSDDLPNIVKAPAPEFGRPGSAFYRRPR